ncbi:nucleotide exchange factor GrpE [Nocardia sp. 004]|uniref:nucleotide exchange factor GrpE n=1 Tax=Nocardia sp. 004 TaxID=3385978 RepID=UPI00399FF586
MTEGNSEKEPITFVDNRKIDPDSGEIRQQAADNGTAAEAAQDVEAQQLADTISGELAERTADLQRLTAEYANYRRRVERDRQATIDSAKASVVTELLSVLDDLDRARAHGDLESGPLKSVADKLSDALVKQGLAEFGSEGEPFDPTLHEAVQHEGSGHDPVIGIVMRKGYRFGDRVLRHALVGVTDGVSDLAETADRAEAADGKTEEASDVDAGTSDR